MINDLSHANFALLRRNIGAFQSPRRDYFPVVDSSGPKPTTKAQRSKTDTRPRPKNLTEERGSPMFAAIVRFIREWKRYNNSVSELSRLGDRELADIGINRAEIASVAWKATHSR
jgi:uncharacterized protein YjiS (DUF1127 family)